MSINILSDDFSQAKAILRDAHFKVSADRNKKENIGLLKLLKARAENIDFEIELAERICGDNPKFPYRSSYFLTKFFQDLGFNFTHDGSTRRFWVRDMLLQLDIIQISRSIENGLFRRKDFKNRSFRTTKNEELSDDDFLNNAILDFKDFIDESIRVNETVNLDQILNLNLNIELLFDNKTETKDEELNKLIEEAKERFLKPDDQNVALEKLWDAFERIKTYYDPNKKKSANRLIDQISIDLDRDIFAKEFEMLTNIGNNYRIRHHETDKKPINTANQINYLFFRMLSLIDLSLVGLRESGNGSEK
ncbi:MAG: hypothetical protein HQ557_06265 [Bacteroidetes bacterium]|nr:hypothetical protein [Bacteroidota bacterium]